MRRVTIHWKFSFWSTLILLSTQLRYTIYVFSSSENVHFPLSNCFNKKKEWEKKTKNIFFRQSVTKSTKEQNLMLCSTLHNYSEIMLMTSSICHANFHPYCFLLQAVASYIRSCPFPSSGPLLVLRSEM